MRLQGSLLNKNCYVIYTRFGCESPRIQALRGLCISVPQAGAVAGLAAPVLCAPSALNH